MNAPNKPLSGLAGWLHDIYLLANCKLANPEVMFCETERGRQHILSGWNYECQSAAVAKALQAGASLT
jgi:hypothetical protein